MTNSTKKRWFNYGVLTLVAGVLAVIVAQGYAESDRPLEGTVIAERTPDR